MALNSVLPIAVSGLNASSQRVETAANNIVNANTPDFNASRVEASSVVFSSGTGGAGVQTQVLAGSEPTSLIREVTNLVEAEAAYKANAKVIQTTRELTKESLDILT